MAKLYFSKVNINEQIYDVYDNINLKKKILDELFTKLKEGTEVVIEESDYFEEDDGTKQTIDKNTKYLLIDLQKNIQKNYISGRVIKFDKIKRKQLVENKLTTYIEDDHIPITFYFDFFSQIVIFSKKRKFGYQAFNKAFQKIICSSFSKNAFRIQVIKSEENIRKTLRNFKKITKMESTIIPPNPNEKEFALLLDEDVKEMKEGNVKKIKKMIEGGIKGIIKSSRIVTRLIATSVLGYGYNTITGIDYSNKPLEINDNKKSPYTSMLKESEKDNLAYLNKVAEDEISKVQKMRSDVLESIENE